MEEEDGEEEVVKLTDPGTVVDLIGVPDSLGTSIRRDDGKSSVVKFYEEETFARVDVKKIEELGHSNIDLKRSRFPGILQKYHWDLSDLKYNI